MQRKLIQLSPSTAVVSLPASWIKHNRLTKGKAIFVDEQENKLIISAVSKKTEKEITADVKGFSNRLMWNYFDALYICGYDNITLLTRDNAQSALIGKIIKFFPGLIIEEERKNIVRIVDVADNPTENLDKMLARMFHITITILEDSIDALKNKDYAVLLSMKDRDYHINSYASYCFRQLNKYGYQNYSKTAIMHTYVKILEMITDRICIYLKIIANKKDKRIADLTKILELYKQVYGLHYNYSEKKLLDTEEEHHKMMQSKDAEFISSTSLFFDILEIEMQLHG